MDYSQLIADTDFLIERWKSDPALGPSLKESRRNKAVQILISSDRLSKSERDLLQAYLNIPREALTELGLYDPEPAQPAKSTAKITREELNPCEPKVRERWGVKFTYDVGGESDFSCEPGTALDTRNSGGQSRDWYLSLLPAMESVAANRGGRDVPNAMPGLQFKVANNIVKHRIPGYQPVIQNMGIETTLITLVGTFSGDGGLGHIHAAGNSQEIGGGTFPYPPGHPNGGAGINPRTNPIYNVWNRGVYSGLRERNPGPAWLAMNYEPRSRGNPAIISNDILRQGMFERDGCFGQCPIPVRQSATNRDINFGSFDRGLHNTPDLLEHYTLGHIAAYLDAFKEFSSFYQLTIQQGKELTIEINLRKSRDGLFPEAKYTDPRYQHDYSPHRDPLRDNDTGNVKFKGYIKTMEVYAARSDRVWYTMQFEVSDHGMAGSEPVNLNYVVEQATDDLMKDCAAEEVQQVKCKDLKCGQTVLLSQGRVRESKSGRETDSGNVLLYRNGGGSIKNGDTCTEPLNPGQLATQLLSGESAEDKQLKRGMRGKGRTYQSQARNTLAEMRRIAQQGRKPPSNLEDAWSEGEALEYGSDTAEVRVTGDGWAITRYDRGDQDPQYTISDPPISRISERDVMILLNRLPNTECEDESIGRPSTQRERSSRPTARSSNLGRRVFSPLSSLNEDTNPQQLISTLNSIRVSAESVATQEVGQESTQSQVSNRLRASLRTRLGGSYDSLLSNNEVKAVHDNLLNAMFVNTGLYTQLLDDYNAS